METLRQTNLHTGHEKPTLPQGEDNMRRYSWLLGVLGLCACSGSVIDVGPGSVGGAESGGNTNVAGSGNTGGQQSSVPAELACQDQAPLPTWPSTDACASASDLPIVGTWHGYVEQQPAPWDELTLVIRGASVSGGVCGSLTFGSGPIPPPATNPDQDYPTANSPSYPLAPTPGLPQTLLNGDTDGTRLRFTISLGETLRSWCALQDSYQRSSGDRCNCLPNWSSESAGGQTTMKDPAGKHNLHVSFTRMIKCSMFNICACNAQGCDGAPDLNGTPFDLRFTANSAEGNDGLHSGARVYFTRVP